MKQDSSPCTIAAKTFTPKPPAKTGLDRKTSMGRKAGSPDHHPAKTIEATLAPANSIFRRSPSSMDLI
jgi:hypothetical protein